MVILEVRRLVIDKRNQLGARKVDEYCRKALDILHNQDLNSIRNYRQKLISGKRYSFRDDKNQLWIDGDKIVDDYKGSKPYLFFCPYDACLATGDGDLDTRYTYGFGDNNVAIVSWDGSRTQNSVQHELGHAWFGLGHHYKDRDKNCAMGIEKVNYCDPCLEKAQIADRRHSKSQP